MKFLIVILLSAIPLFSCASEPQENSSLYKPFNLVYEPDESFCAHFENSVSFGEVDFSKKDNQFIKTSRIEWNKEKKFSRENASFKVGFHDLDNNGIKDTFLIDWMPVYSYTFYLATYIIFDEGEGYNFREVDKKSISKEEYYSYLKEKGKVWSRLENKLLEKRFYERHEEGYYPIFPRDFSFEHVNDDEFYGGSFYPFTKISIVNFQNNNYLLVQSLHKRDSKETTIYQAKDSLLISISRADHTAYLKCKF